MVMIIFVENLITRNLCCRCFDSSLTLCLHNLSLFRPPSLPLRLHRFHAWTISGVLYKSMYSDCVPIKYCLSFHNVCLQFY